VHRGGLDVDNPFDESGLVQKNITADAWDKTRHKRLRASPMLQTLRSLVQSQDETWCRLAHIAHFRAEETRSAGGDFDASLALRGWEHNPFQWDVRVEWKSQLSITFLWSWNAATGVQRRAFVTARLDNVLDRSHVPCPANMSQQDAETYRRLLSAAEVEVKESKAPCVYLGMETAPGTFEPGVFFSN